MYLAKIPLFFENVLFSFKMAEQKHEFEDSLERKDRMLNEVKDALKTLGLKLGNLDSKTAIPKLKALLSNLFVFCGLFRSVILKLAKQINKLLFFFHFADTYQAVSKE